MRHMTTVTMRVHQDHPAEHPGVQHGREGYDSDGDQPDGDDTNRETGHEPTRTRWHRLADRGGGLSSTDGMGCRIVDMTRHG
jgi:hypothetical protein